MFRYIEYVRIRVSEFTVISLHYLIAVAHKQFKQMSVKDIQGLMNDHPVLIDVRGMLDQKIVKEKDLYYRKL